MIGVDKKCCSKIWSGFGTESISFSVVYKVPEPTESEWSGVEPLGFLWGCSKQITDFVEQIQFKEARRFIAERCFRRIMLMMLTFLRWNPVASFFPANGHWDLYSSAAVARCRTDLKS
jgi:hypothetical protein